MPKHPSTPPASRAKTAHDLPPSTTATPGKRLLIDAGNSQIKAIQAQAFTLLPATLHHSTHIDSAALTTLATDCEEIIVASVNAVDWHTQFAACRELSHVPIHVLHSQAQHRLLRNAYTQPQLLGIDRWAAMLGARLSCQDQALCVVDLGTATTLDAVSATGVHLGGWIIPGLATSREQLLQRGHLLSNAGPGQLQSFASNTADAICSGTHHAQIAVIHRFLDLMRQHEAPSPRLYLTGGWAQSVFPELQCEAVFDPLLVFRGMLAHHLLETRDHSTRLG